MVKNLERDYSEFDYSYDDTELSHEEIVARREVVYMPTGYETEIGIPQYLAVARMLPEGYDLDGPGPDSVPIISFPAFSDETAVRPDSSAPFRLAQANPLDRTIYTVQAPGVHSWWLRDMPRDTTHRRTREQRESMGRGSFVHIGRACLAAVRAADAYFNGGKRQNETYDLHGSSQGAGIATGTLESLVIDDDRSFKVTGAAVSELVNYRSYSINPIDLFAKFAQLDTKYVDCNPLSVRRAEEPPHMWTRRLVSSPAANLGPWRGYGAALARGDVNSLGGREGIPLLGKSGLDIPIVAAWGAESALTNEESRLRLNRNLTRAGVTNLMIVNEGHDHGYTLTAQSVVSEIMTLEELQGLRAA